MSKKAKVALWLFGLSIFYLLFFMHPTMWRDESFTMALVHHNYGDIIRLDAMDVHPPLYYLLLKSFLGLTTFWTSSLFTKVYVARFFSYLITILTFVVLSRTVRNMGVPGGNAIQWAGFFLAPNIMRYATQMRMYALAGLLLALLFNQLQHYDHCHKVGHIFLAVLWASLASYTHYFAAIAAGWLLIIYFVKFQFAKYDLHAFIRAIWIFILMFIPWGVVACFQFRMVTTSSYWIPPVTGQTILDNFTDLFTDMFGFNGSQWYAIGFAVVCLCTIIWAYINMNKAFKVAMTIVLAVFVLTNVTGIVISMVIRPIYIARYAYPIYAILIFFVMVIISQMIKVPFHHGFTYYWNILVVTAVAVLIGANIGFLGSNQFENYILPSWELSDTISLYQESPTQTIRLNADQGTNTIAEKIVYIQYMDKQVELKNFQIGHLVGNNNQELFHGVFDNVNVKMYNKKG